MELIECKGSYRLELNSARLLLKNPLHLYIEFESLRHECKIVIPPNSNVLTNVKLMKEEDSSSDDDDYDSDSDGYPYYDDYYEFDYYDVDTESGSDSSNSHHSTIICVCLFSSTNEMKH